MILVKGVPKEDSTPGGTVPVVSGYTTIIEGGIPTSRGPRATVSCNLWTKSADCSWPVSSFSPPFSIAELVHFHCSTPPCHVGSISMGGMAIELS